MFFRRWRDRVLVREFHDRLRGRGRWRCPSTNATPPWLEGRLCGLAEEISETLDETAHCTRYVNALTQGKKRFTPQNIDELRRLIEEDLRLHQAELSGGYRAAYDEISRGLTFPRRSSPLHQHRCAALSLTGSSAIYSEVDA
ncbi:hypothetical protein R2B67_00425 [Streptomyces cyaneofuscatus]|uniref:hypothetical protein n=1 Tax=Streptomyces cyaneofuscatus TaxID=66883 RepID=UPI002954AA0D|nr:hypothetical protein [Streptomyces cyaneofuscatus]WOP13972.1 hypothetical protein R2B67_00425 [Streptomyces cyaneofuscatus]